MMSRRLRNVLMVSLVVVLSAGVASAAAKGLDKTGKPDLKSIGPIAFGPEGVLFVGDPMGASLFAIGVDPASGTPSPGFKVEGIDAKLANLVGVKAEDITINDIAVQPGSGTAFLSVSRGKGVDAQPVLAKVTATGAVSVVPLDNVAYAVISLKNAPTLEEKDRRGTPKRTQSITDLHYIEGKVFVAGLATEQFASTLHGVEFPFAAKDLATSIEIYHGNHGAVETNAPVRTFVPFVVNGQPHILAAYTCTPLVSIPVAELKDGAKLRGKTVAELGQMNNPLDIISYEKGGQKYLLMANTTRGVMKITTDKLATQEAIEARVGGTAGVAFETIANLKGVEHLDKLGDQMALLLVKTENGSKNLESVPLP